MSWRPTEVEDRYISELYEAAKRRYAGNRLVLRYLAVSEDKGRELIRMKHWREAFKQYRADPDDYLQIEAVCAELSLELMTMFRDAGDELQKVRSEVWGDPVYSSMRKW